MQFIKSLFRKPSLKETISRELAEAEMALLGAQTSLDYATSVVQFNKARIIRLDKALKAVPSSIAEEKVLS